MIRCHQCVTWCDRVSSVYDLALGKCSGISRHATNPWLCYACLPFTTTNPAPTQPTISMTTYSLAQAVTKSSAFHVLLIIIIVLTIELKTMSAFKTSCLRREMKLLCYSQQSEKLNRAILSATFCSKYNLCSCSALVFFHTTSAN